MEKSENGYSLALDQDSAGFQKWVTSIDLWKQQAYEEVFCQEPRFFGCSRHFQKEEDLVHSDRWMTILPIESARKVFKKKSKK